MAKLHKRDIKIIELLKSIPEGTTAKEISKTLNLKNRTLYNHLFNLKQKGFLIHIFPFWKIAKNQADSLNLAKSKIQSHKFSFKLVLLKKPDWWENRENKIIKLKDFEYKGEVKWGNLKYQQLSRDNFIIQTFPNTIVIINQKEYFGDTSYDCLIKSIEDTSKIIEFIEKRFRFKFFYEGIPQLSIKTNHYVNLRDELAKKCKKENNLLRLEIDNKLRAWIDLSEPFGIEFGDKNYGTEDSSRYLKQVEDFLKYNPPTNSQLATHLNNFITGFEVYGKHIESHTGAIIKLNKSINKLTSFIGKKVEENFKLKNKGQKRLGEFI